MSGVVIPVLVGVVVVGFILLIMCLCSNKNKGSTVVRYDPSR